MHVDNFHMCLFWQLPCSYAFSICHIHDSSGTAQTNLSLHITPAIAMASGSKPVLPATVVQEVNAIMDSTKPVNHKVDLIVKLLHQHGLARSQQLKPNDFLCHPSNRANLMLNHHDVWKKGMAMLQVGICHQPCNTLNSCYQILPACCQMLRLPDHFLQPHHGIFEGPRHQPTCGGSQE